MMLRITPFPARMKQRLPMRDLDIIPNRHHIRTRLLNQIEVNGHDRKSQQIDPKHGRQSPLPSPRFFNAPMIFPLANQARIESFATT
jgi:hypothetical protein